MSGFRFPQAQLRGLVAAAGVLAALNAAAPGKHSAAVSIDQLRK
ncbi:MAG: hypothetical protein ACK559_37230 [bacterium]